MKIALKALFILLRTLAVILLVIAAYVMWGFLVAPVYRFAPAEPFRGERIYNPYAGTTDSTRWFRANLHAHTYLRFGLTYGAKTPEGMVADYRSYDYDIIGLSNYMTITRYEPAGRDAYNIPVYEHGYNPLLFHQLVFGARGLTAFDIPLPVFPFQKQFVLERVGRNADIFVVNHPAFSRGFPVRAMNKLQGYRLIEAESGMAASARYWDTGLSAGRASFCLSGDDSHDTSRPHDIATDCSFIAARSTKYADILEALRAGRHYAMKIPNFGDGDTTVKHAMNRLLPRVTRVGMRGDTIEVAFSQPASQIAFIGQGGATVLTVADTAAAKYLFGEGDTYIRVGATFPNGVHIFLNPFFRYSGEDPFAIAPLRVRLAATMSKDLVCMALIVVSLWTVYRTIKPYRRNGKGKGAARYR